MKKITLLEIKEAMRDSRFRNNLPPELQDDVKKYLKNPKCKCNLPIYLRIMKECKKQIKEYFPGRAIIDPNEEINKIAQNNWTVINCHIDQLAARLKKLPTGRKQLAITRYEDQVTVVINELNAVW